MKNNTVYLLYNTNATNIQFHQKPPANIKEVNGKLVWEYIDKDKFTITYGPDDDRNFTDITILSKTKLKDRPQTADSFFKQPKGNVEGLVVQKSSSFSFIENVLLVRRSPLIKPLLSETEIKSLQQFQEQCRHRHHTSFGVEKRTGSKEGQGLRGSLGEESSAVEEKRQLQILLGRKGDENRQTDLRNVHAGDNILGRKRDLGIVEPIYHGQNYKKAKKEIGDNLISRSLKGKIKEIIKTPDVKKHTVDNMRHDTNPKKAKKTKKKIKDASDKYQEYDSDSNMDTKKHQNKFKDRTANNTQKSRKKKQILELKGSDSDYSLSKESGKNLSKVKSKLKKSLNDDSDDKHDKDKGVKTSISKKTVKSSKSKQLDRITHDTEKKTTSDGMIKSTEPFSDEEHIHKNRRAKSRDLSKGDSSKEKSISNNKAQMSEKGMEKRTAKRDSKTGKSKVSIDKDYLTMTSSRAKVKSGSVQLSGHDKVRVKEDVACKKSSRTSAVIQYMIQYILSNPVFIKLGWTLQPVDHSLSRIITFKAHPAIPKSYCFRQRNEEEIKYYPWGSLAVRMETDGTGAIFYPSGSPAVLAARNDRGMRLTLYSDPKMDPLIKDSNQAKIIGMFDNFGNGVVYDLLGNKILHFNQLEGVFNNPKGRIPYKWRWNCYKELEDQRIKELLRSVVKDEKQSVPPSNKKVMNTATSNAKKGTTDKKSDDHFYESILAELPYPAPLKSKVKTKSQAIGFKSIILKINEEMTLRINGQNNIVLNFSTNKVFYRMELGVVVDAEVVEQIDELAVEKIGEVPCVFDSLLYLSPSLAALNLKHHS